MHADLSHFQLNNCCGHYSPLKEDSVELKEGDVAKMCVLMHVLKTDHLSVEPLGAAPYMPCRKRLLFHEIRWKGTPLNVV
jgi:hypothetical protein